VVGKLQLSLGWKSPGFLKKLEEYLPYRYGTFSSKIIEKKYRIGAIVYGTDQTEKFIGTAHRYFYDRMKVETEALVNVQKDYLYTTLPLVVPYVATSEYRGRYPG
jgi:hypothetical protein